MIFIETQPADAAALAQEYPSGSVERETIQILAAGSHRYRYASEDRLRFELTLRREIVHAARALGASGLAFATFRRSFCNTDYWERMPDGGFAVKTGVNPADAVRDILRSSHRYGTECATAMLMVYYLALAEVFPERAFREVFRNIYLMNWHRIEDPLREVGVMRHTGDYLPGDRRYFKNPDVEPTTPEYQGENVIDLGGGLYYGHGAGIQRAEALIRMLNQNRRADADEETYLLPGVARPNFARLAALLDRYAPPASLPA